MRAVNEITCGCVEHDDVRTQVKGFKIKIISKVIKTPKETNVMMFQINAQVDALIVVVQHTVSDRGDMGIYSVKINYL